MGRKSSCTEGHSGLSALPHSVCAPHYCTCLQQSVTHTGVYQVKVCQNFVECFTYSKNSQLCLCTLNHSDLLVRKPHTAHFLASPEMKELLRMHKCNIISPWPIKMAKRRAAKNVSGQRGSSWTLYCY